MPRFSKLPTWWVRDPGLTTFIGGAQAGESIAALKVLIAISTLMDFYTCRARNSFSDLEKLTGLSRPMVQRGIERLEAGCIARVDREGHINEYELISSAGKDSGWAKIPYERIRKHLAELPNRGVVPLAALKSYVLLASLRPNDSPSLALSHEKMREMTGVQKRHIRPGLDVLFSHTLIRLHESDAETPQGRHNVYTLLGL